MQRWKLILEYDGSAFAGWQRQEAGVPSVQLALEDAIQAFYGSPVTIHVAGRTDAGVHAQGQVAHVDLALDSRYDGFTLAKAINAHLKLAGHLVAVIAAQTVSDDFHARFSARNKLYLYRLVTRSAPPVMDSGRVHVLHHDLNLPAMQAATRPLLGQHDFTTFRATGCQAKSPVRTLERLDITAVPYDATGALEYRIETEARSFLHHQVRNMVGSLVLVGLGKWTPEDMAAALAARDRRRGGPTAPPGGLYLMRVDY